MTIIMKRPSKQGEQQSSIMRPLTFLVISLAAVILLSKTSLTAAETTTQEEPPSSALRQRKAQEGEGGRTFVFEIASLTGGKTGEVVIQTKPEWAPLGVKVGPPSIYGCAKTLVLFAWYINAEITLLATFLSSTSTI